MSNQNNYIELQKQIDKVIGKVGSEGLIEILSIFNDYTNEEKLCMFIKNCVAAYYKVSFHEIFKTGRRGYVNARIISYYLLRSHLSYTFDKVGKVCNRERSRVKEKYDEMVYYLQNPLVDPQLIIDFNCINVQVEEFINYLKKVTYGQT